MLYTAVFAIYLPQQGYNLPSLELIPQPFSCKRTLLPTEIELLSNNERQKLEEMMMRKKQGYIFAKEHSTFRTGCQFKEIGI